MKRITTAVMGLAALVAMLVLGVFSAGAAQAHTFLWTGAAPSLLLILGDGPQVFTAIPGGNSVTCSHVHLHGKATAESQLTVTVVGEYTGCEALGFATTVTPAEYEISADETVLVTNKTIQIKIGGICTIDIKPQDVNKIRYLVDPNSANQRILAHAEVGKIVSTILGGAGFCGAEGEAPEGTYRGLLLAWVHGAGTLKWS